MNVPSYQAYTDKMPFEEINSKPKEDSAEETSCDLMVLGVMIVKRLEIFDCTKINAKNHEMLQIKSSVAHETIATCGGAVDVYISAAR